MVANNFRVLQQIIVNIKSLEKSYLSNAKILSENIDSDERNPNLELINKIDSAELISGLEINYTSQGIVFITERPQYWWSDDDGGHNYYRTAYNYFFDNELFQRPDVFDQIVISKIKLSDGEIEDGEIIYANAPVGILDTAFFEKTIYKAKSQVLIDDSRYIAFNYRLNKEFGIYISGLIKNERFNNEKRAVTPFIVFILTIILILIVLAIPLIKLKIMSIHERLYIKDVAFAIFSVLVGPAVFLIFLYAFMSIFGKEQARVNHHLQKLSSKVEANFETEISEMVHQIKAVDARFPQVGDSSVLVDDSIDVAGVDNLNKYFVQYQMPEQTKNKHFSMVWTKNLSKTKPKSVRGYKIFKDVTQRDIIKFKHLKALFWCDSLARTMVVLSAFSKPSYAQDLHHRKYLTNIINSNPDIFEDSRENKYKIAIESIKSVNDGAYEIGVGWGTGRKTLPVLAMSTKLASVMGAVLKPGYGFCILDKEGNTMFHSDITKNMNENFIKETKGVFKPSMQSHTAAIKNIQYNGEMQTVYLRPMRCLSDHYIATFAATQINYGPFTHSMISSFILFAGYLILILVLFLLLYYALFKPSKLKQKFHLFSFVRPYESWAHYKKYQRLIRVNLLVIGYLLLCLVVNRHYYDFILIELMLISCMLLITSFFSLLDYIPNSQSFCKSIPTKLKNAVAIVLPVIMLVRVVALLAQGSKLSIVLNAILGVGVVIYMVYEFLSDKQPSLAIVKENENASVSRCQRSYKLYMFQWVLILSLIPILIFLQTAYEKEWDIASKYSSFQLVTQIEGWHANNREEFADKFEDPSSYLRFANSMTKNHLNYAFDTATIKFIHQGPAKQTPACNAIIFDKIYAQIRPAYNSRSTLTRQFISNYATDTTWGFVQKNGRKAFIMESSFGSEKYYQVIEPQMDFFVHHLPGITLISLLSGFILFGFLNFTLDRVYGFGYKKYALKKHLSDNLKFRFEFLLDKKSEYRSAYNNLFVVNVNAAFTCGIRNFLKEHFKDKLIVLDFYELQKEKHTEKKENPDLRHAVAPWAHEWAKFENWLVDKTGKRYVLIEHFEYGYNDVQFNKQKIDILQQLVDYEEIKVVINSEINATKLLDYYIDDIKRLDKLLKKTNIENLMGHQQQMDNLKIDYKKWQHLLGSFTKCVMPLAIIGEDLELNRGEFLNMLEKYIGSGLKGQISADDKVLAIQQMSFPYYHAVWNSLSKEERYIVYDIAKDKFVNTINVNGIMSLLDKGILVYDYALRIMNDSFANFVLTKVDSDEALEMEIQSRKKGNWNTAFAVIFLLIISLVVFLSIGQQNFLNELNAFLTAIAALVGLLMRFGGFLSLGGKKLNGA